MLSKTELQSRIVAAVEAVKAKTPLIPSITNTVTINFVANTQLAVGGSAAMVYLPDEGVLMAELGGAMYINVGTLEPIYTETLPATFARLHALGKPWVLDPVAVGIGEMRTNLLQTSKGAKPTIIKGNASEIIALAGLWDLAGGTADSQVKGVDTTDPVEHARAAAIALAQFTGGAVIVSGIRDLVTDGKTVTYAAGGSKYMGLITGAGCSLGGVTAVYASQTDPLTAALTAVQIYNLAGQRAEQNATGPASFQVQFIDELYRATATEIANSPFESEEA
ncbi:MAG: hydroxyethylthiazole kinase [Lactobacillaceae bacterium]|jgi:hydroxyethylthiazole kinase|nr:hydroxyethylthiazole kinase [Lactobacillaceae bacterium]